MHDLYFFFSISSTVFFFAQFNVILAVEPRIPLKLYDYSQKYIYSILAYA